VAVDVKAEHVVVWRQSGEPERPQVEDLLRLLVHQLQGVVMQFGARDARAGG
jgi:hypothetical protein